MKRLKQACHRKVNPRDVSGCGGYLSPCCSSPPLAEAIPNNKSPGTDGIPSEVGDTLLPMLLRVYNEAMKGGLLPDSMNEAVIIVLLKPCKETTLSDSYRPISLLTTDVKLLARVLATRLAQVIHKLVHKDQSGFIPTRFTAQNIRRLFLNLQLPVENTGNRTKFFRWTQQRPSTVSCGLTCGKCWIR